MIYHLSLRMAGMLSAFFLIALSLVALLRAENVKAFLRSLPRSRPAGLILFTLAVLWSFWLLATMDMGEFSSFRRPLMFALPILAILVVKFVDEFLAVRALGILFLLAAEPLLEAAFLRYEHSRLFVTTFAYIMIVLGLFWGISPYVLRNQITWLTRSSTRWHGFHVLTLLYGVITLVLACTKY